MRLVISGGGTGGHIFPALAIADAVKEKCNDADILFVGAKDRMEMEIVPKYGYPIKGLWISGFQRSFSIKNLLFPIKLATSWWCARSIVSQFNPDVAIGVGGFASGPIIKAVASKNIPYIIQEQNSYAGVTNRLLAKMASFICVGYEGMERFFPKDKLRITGNPIRKKIVDSIQNITSSEELRQAIRKNWAIRQNNKVVVCMGGSLGARSINQGLANSVDEIRNSPEITWIWQTGKTNFDLYKDLEIARLSNVIIVPFFEKMEEIYAIADLIVSRAGALSLSEICLAGKASVLVPSPYVAEDHQTANAMSMVKKDAAVLVEDKDTHRLVGRCIELVKDDKLLVELGKNAGKLAKPQAAYDIADMIISLSKRSAI